MAPHQPHQLHHHYCTEASPFRPYQRIDNPIAAPRGTVVATEQIAARSVPERRKTYHARVLADPYHALERYADFVLRYCWDPEHDGCVRVYVEDQPSYGGR